MIDQGFIHIANDLKCKDVKLYCPPFKSKVQSCRWAVETTCCYDKQLELGSVYILFLKIHRYVTSLACVYKVDEIKKITCLPVSF